MPVDLLDDVSAVTVTNVGVTNKASLESKQSSIAQDRLDRLCKKLEEDGYILKVEIANYFMVSVLLISVIDCFPYKPRALHADC